MALVRYFEPLKPGPGSSPAAQNPAGFLLSPVLVGSAIAWHDTHALLWLPLPLAAAGRCLHPDRHNLFNDVGGYLRGTDTPVASALARHCRGWLDAW